MIAEMHKVLPQMLHKFKFELVSPDKPLGHKNWWFNKQTGFNVRVSHRQ